MNDGVTFNNAHCSSVGLEVLDSRRPLFAETRDEYVDIPYSDGSVHIPDNSKRDLEVEVDFFLNDVPGKSFHDACRDVAAWLDTIERQRLIFDDDPNYYYEAKPSGKIDRERIAEYGMFTVVFRCHPVMKAV